MKVGTRLALLYTLITATILLVFATVIYISASGNREKEFFSVLKNEALTKANLFFKAKVDDQTLQDIYKVNRETINEVEVAIYNRDFELFYHDALDIDAVKETQEMIHEIYSKGEKKFFQGDWQVVGLTYDFEGERYIITATALDQYGYKKLENLFQTMILVFIISILFIYLAGRFFSKKAMQPVSEMTEKAKQISANNLNIRITENKNKDELATLASTFNEMLDHLEASFEAQKHFVSNISHEIRTPLAAIIAELELTSNKIRTIEEYQKAVDNTRNDAMKLARLSNSLLDFAKASYDSSTISFKPVRIDEILLDAHQQVLKANPDYKIDLHFEGDFDNEDQISSFGNEYLLMVAFTNLMENGCKFSEDKRSTVNISLNMTEIVLRFIDQGVGIPASDMESIFNPFYRGENKSFAEGNGIGLSLTQRIIHLHKGSISISSVLRLGTTFQIVLPNNAQ